MKVPHMHHSLAQIIDQFDPAGQFEPPAHWLQGRTLYGGLTAALALQAALRNHAGALPPLKSAQIAFVGPSSGALRFSSKLLRQGKSASWVLADCQAGPELSLHAQFLFAAPRDVALGAAESGAGPLQHVRLERPQVQAPDAYAPLGHSEVAPASFGNFEVRPVDRRLPYSGAAEPVITAWVRHLDAAGVDAAVALLALADALPPAVVASLRQPGRFSSMTWSVDLCQPARPGTWYLMRSSSQQAANGYSFQHMAMWDEEGELVLVGSQTVGVYG